MTDLKETTRQQLDRKRIDTIWWAGAFIWIGLTLGAEYLEILPEIANTNGWWAWILIGLGPWSLVFNTYRSATDWPNPTTWDWIWTAIFLLVGVGTIVDLGGEIVGAAVLIGAGIVLLIRALSAP